ncbi:hypothetical protein BC830DRAFT_1158408 [Chytriomyces sp. MP71]|nr:hypothetical protein BC830DRAFT_1158408 [Chytriomyces sp. MP71]
MVPHRNAGKVALVVGASRGIGAQTALSLAEDGYTVVLSSRSVGSPTPVPASQPKSLASPSLSLFDMQQMIVAKGGKAHVMACDVTNEASIEALVRETLAKLGRIDVAVYNAGAIFWGSVKDTPFKRFHLLTRVNPIGLYKLIDALLPHFNQHKRGRFVVVSPPIYSRFFRGKTAYAMGKVAMTVLTHGLAMELDTSKDDIAITSIWPATAIQSAVTEVQNLPSDLLRDPKIFGDAIVGICNEPASKINGLAVLDEDYLREFRGMTDFSVYRVNPAVEPPRMMPKKFPCLLVDEQDERGFLNVSSIGKEKVNEKEMGTKQAAKL